MRASSRLERMPPYLYARLVQRIADKKAAGVDVLSLGIGDLDNPTPSLVVDALADAVRRVATGGSALDPEVVAMLLGRRRRDDPLAALTPREREVLGLMAEGRSNTAIAESLVVTERAVEKHVTAIFTKLDLAPAPEDHRRVLAVLAYLRAA